MKKSSLKILSPEAELKRTLKELNYCFNVATSRVAFKTEFRYYGKMAELFGVKVEDKEFASRSIKIKDVEIFHEQLKQIAKDRITSRRYLYGQSIKEETQNTILPINENSDESRSRDFENGADETQNIKHSTYIPRYPDQKAILLTKEAPQEVSAKLLWDNFTLNNYLTQLLIAQTGSGKTYILGSFLKNFIEQGWIAKLSCYSPWPIMYVTKASVVDQTEGVLRKKFGIDTAVTVSVINIEMLRTKLGSKFVKEETIVTNGQPEIKFRWVKNIHPCLIIWDECQILARTQSTQSKIAQAFTRIPDEYSVPVLNILASATPGSRVCEFKVFACGTRAKFQLGSGEGIINEENWSIYSNRIADPSDPYQYCEAAVKRLIDHLEPYIVRVKGIRPKHKAYNSVNRLQFANKEEADEYNKAWEEYQKKKAQIEGDQSLSASQERFALLAQFTIFAKKAEYIRRFHIAKFAADCWNRGEAPVIACRNKATITAVVKILIMDYGWNRDDISIIWGGATETLSNKKKLAKKIKENDLAVEELEKLGITLEDLGLDIEINEKTEEDLAFERVNNLLTQKPEDRERERLRFQKQLSRVCIFTFKAGGVGLSLHHEEEYPNARPRRTLFTPVYSEKELVQAIGRAPRITSMSDTYQVMGYYADTIEEHMASRVVMKLKCLKNVVKIPESWESIITGRPLLDSGNNEEILDAVDEIETTNTEMMEYKE